LGMQPDQDVINRWTGSAPYWEKNREMIGRMFAPITQALVEDAEIGGGHVVLDVATGPGEPALSLAAVVGPEGKIFGIDPIPEMVAGARRAAEGLGLGNVRFEVAGADQLPFPDNLFDAVISRFGVMFFPSPVDGVREMLRVLKPGEKVALAAWHVVESNPFFYSMARVIDQYFEPAPLASDAPDAFRFASRGKLLEVVREAGVAAPAERLVQCKIEAAMPVEDFWTLRIEMSEKLREKIGTLSGDRLAEVRRRGIESLSEYSAGGRLSFPAEVLVVSGRKVSGGDLRG
jgi:ubiquinone/menaquinone biosynthesis C-methylase UbiE